MKVATVTTLLLQQQVNNEEDSGYPVATRTLSRDVMQFERLTDHPLTFTSILVSSCFSHQRAIFISSPSRYRHEKKGRQRNNFLIVIVFVDENNTATSQPVVFFWQIQMLYGLIFRKSGQHKTMAAQSGHSACLY